MNLNKAELIGNLTADPELRTMPTGQSIASFRLATNYAWRDHKSKEMKKSAEYHPIIAWGRLGDVVGKYLKKGDRVYIDGRMHTRFWQGKDGVKRNRTEVIAQNLIMLGGAKAKAEPQTDKVNDEVVVEEIDVTNAPVSE